MRWSYQTLFDFPRRDQDPNLPNLRSSPTADLAPLNLPHMALLLRSTWKP